MRYYFIFLLFLGLCVSDFCSAQDILILRKDESEVKCRILSVTDSTYIYKLWKSADTTSYTLKKFEVLSYMLSKKTINSGKVAMNEEDDLETNLLEPYRMNENVLGYVVTTSNDTVHGILVLKNVVQNELGITFIGENKKSTYYKPGEIKGYGYDNVAFESINTKYKKELTNKKYAVDGNLFLHRKVDGPAKLYMFFRLFYSKSALLANPDPPVYDGDLEYDYVIVNTFGKQTLTINKGIRNVLIDLFGDYKALTEELIDENKWKKNVPNVISKYNYWYLNK